MKTVSLDASTKCTGWCAMEDGTYIESGFIEMKTKMDVEERINYMTKKICEVLKLHSPAVVYLEDTMQKSNVKTLKNLCWLAGGIRYWCFAHGVEVVMVMPSEWRSKLGIQEGRAKRNELKIKAIQKVNDELGLFLDEDQAEAVCINLAMSKEK